MTTIFTATASASAVLTAGSPAYVAVLVYGDPDDSALAQVLARLETRLGQQTTATGQSHPTRVMEHQTRFNECRETAIDFRPRRGRTSPVS